MDPDCRIDQEQMSQRAAVGKNEKPDHIAEEPQHTRSCRQQCQTRRTSKDEGSYQESDADEHIQYDHATCSAQRLREGVGRQLALLDKGIRTSRCQLPAIRGTVPAGDQHDHRCCGF